MAITQDYVSTAGVEGNDYKGATFTDGAYTSATKTLTKAGAFAATKVNHYLYLQSNDGGSIVAGYYKVADISGAPNAVVLATDAGAGVDDDAAKCVQHDGTTTKPWRSLQGAFDLCTRNTTDGNQVNLKAGTAQVNAAALDLTTFIAAGALSANAPLIVRGYTSAANDGGIGEIDCGGATMWAATTYTHVGLAALNIHTFGDNDGIRLNNYSVLFNCRIHKGASSPVAKALVYLSSYVYTSVVSCYVYGTGSGAGYGIRGAEVISSYIVTDANLTGYGTYSCRCKNNLVLCQGLVTSGMYDTAFPEGNIVYSTVAGKGTGIRKNDFPPQQLCTNNIVVGFSGAGGVGIGGAGNAPIIGYNAFYNNTAPYAFGDQTWLDLTANDVTLAADPFVDAANGDFSLTVAGKAALRSLGWPASYLGAHANTDPHITIGPMQYGAAEAGGGAVSISPAFGRFL